MNKYLILTIVATYLGLLLIISYFTARKADNAAFFIGNRKSPWYLVAFGMIGASLSGVTFISIPGWVGESNFSYLQMVLGYLVGYAVIANILMPIYYKLQLTSIYAYLETRFGYWSHKTGSGFFLLSRLLGSAIRLYLSVTVLQFVLFDALEIPFYISIIIVIALIYVYTVKGGIKTVVYTDTIQTVFMLASLVLCIFYIGKELHLSIPQMYSEVIHSNYSQIFYFDDWNDKRHFLKQFLSGAFIAIVMTGLDQDMMQKNLSCKNIKEAKKNMYWFSLSLIPANILFLSLGALLYIFAAQTGLALPEKSDQLFPLVATQPFMPAFFILIFILGLLSATYSSADSALTSLTTSFTLDILGGKKYDEKKLRNIRNWVHVSFAFLMALVILVFNYFVDKSVVSAVFTAAGYTYGPLLGLFAFGIFTKWKVMDKWVVLVAILAPILSFILSYYSKILFNGFEFGFELLIVNGLFTFLGLMLIKKK